MIVNVKQTNQIINNNDSESFLSVQYKDPDIEARTKQIKKKAKERKSNSKSNISDSNTHTSEHIMIEIPHEANSSNQKLNGDENGEFGVEIDSIRG